MTPFLYFLTGAGSGIEDVAPIAVDGGVGVVLFFLNTLHAAMVRVIDATMDIFRGLINFLFGFFSVIWGNSFCWYLRDST